MSYTAIITNFQQLVSAGANNVAAIQALFVGDAAPGPANVGLTTGGPQFTNQQNIGYLFTALHRSFPHLVLTYNSNLRLAGGDTVAVEAILETGAHAQRWQPQNAPVSPPISLIDPKQRSSQTLPVCAVFKFVTVGGNDKIKNLALYFDRWQLAKDLWDKANPPHLEPR